MHIAEGFLPAAHCVGWSLASAPFLWDSLRQLRLAMSNHRRFELAAATGFLLFLTALKLPSVAGSCSHPTGIALAVVLFGPRMVPVLGLVVLVLQALLLAHGGLTTLGANVFSLAVCGPWAASLCYQAGRRLGIQAAAAAGIAAALSSVAIYGVTSLQLALAFPDASGGVLASLARFGAIFAWTQIPIAIVEGFLTSSALTLLAKESPLLEAEQAKEIA